MEIKYLNIAKNAVTLLKYVYLYFEDLNNRRNLKKYLL